MACGVALALAIGGRLRAADPPPEAHELNHLGGIE